MCGIGGIFIFGRGASKIDGEELLRIREAMISRGPDGGGIWISDNRTVGLAHRRLSIIDLSDAGAQPMVSADGSLRVTFNGEIYNYLELRKELEEKGICFRSKSDTEVLLYLYAEYGPEMVDKLRGMFAFAIWDGRKRGLFVVRDHLGIKPLYYSIEGHTFRFASQVKALLAGGKIDTTIAPAGHVAFFLLGYSPEPHTFYKNIRALEAGTALWIDEFGDHQIKKYFSLTTLFATAVAENVGSNELRNRLREALLDSVRSHMIADVPVGLFLSSGIDSITLAGLIHRLGLTGLKTLTLSFEEFRGTGLDETLLAEKVAARFATDHKTVRLNLLGPSSRDDLDRIFQFMDQPTVDGINSYFISKAAAQINLKVALSGLGGDELFMGYPTFKQIPTMVGFLKPFERLPQLGRGLRWISTRFLSRFVKPKYAGLFEYGTSEHKAYLLLRGFFLPWELPQVLDVDLARKGWQELEPLLCLEQTTRGIDSHQMKVAALEMAWYMKNQLLMTADWAGMAHSIEIRVPFVDVELLRKLVPLMASRCSPTKRDLVRSVNTERFAGIEEEVLNKPKTGFNVPVGRWLSEIGSPIERTGSEYKDWARFVYEKSGFKK